MSDNPIPPQPNSEAEFTPVDSPEPLKHSGYGIASFTLSIFTLVAFIASVIFVVYQIALSFTEADWSSVENGTITKEQFLDIVVPVVKEYKAIFMGLPLLLLAGLVFGIIGTFKADRRKVYPVLGIVFNLLLLLATAWVFSQALSIEVTPL